jgi:glycosyltransferase involved in cell wall biosynthesis
MATVVVTQHFAPDDTSTSSYLTTVAHEIARDDDVVVISGTPGSASPGGPQQPRVVEVANWQPPKGALVRRSLAMLGFVAGVFFKVLWRANRTTPVIVVTTPFMLPYAAILAAWLRRAPSALMVYDFYPEALITSGLAREGSLPVRFIRLLNEWIFRVLDVIVIVCRDMEKPILRYRAPTAGKIQYISHWATLPPGERAIDPSSRYRAGLGDRFVVGLSGNLGFTHDPETVFAAARMLADDDRISFLLSGWGVGWDRLKRMQQDAQLPNVRLAERVPAEELDDFLAAADAWIIPYRKGMSGISVPSRLFNLLAIGRPIFVLSEPEAEHALILSENDVGWVVPPEDPAALAEAFRAAASDRAATAAKGRRAVGVIGGSFTNEAGGRAYRALAKRLRDRARAAQPS